MAKDGVVSIAIDYKNELNQMIRDYESALTEMASSDKLSKGMKTQFDNTIAELKRFKADMEKSFSDLSIGKVDKNSFKAFKQTVNKNFESVRAEIDNLNLAVSTINSQIKILGNGIDISKISSQFKDFQDYVQNTNNAIDTMIKKLDGQGISLMSFDDSAVNQAKSQIKEINKLLKSTDEFSDAKGSKYELFDTDQAQAELDVLARDLKNTLELIEKSESELSNFDKNSIGFEKTINQINILKLKAADLHDSIQQLMDIPDKTGEYTFGDSILISDDNVDKKVSEYGKIVKGTLDEIRESAIKTREELEKIVTPNSSKTASAKISDKLNPNSAELVTGITIETTSSELWKKLSPILEDLQNDLNKNPVVAPVKLIVAPNAVSSEKNGEVGTISKSYSKKYQRELAKTGEDAVIDLEGVYKKTFTSIMDEAVSYSKETISKIQNIFESSPIKLYFDFNEEEFKKLSNALLSSDSGKKIDITGQIAESKKEVNELADKLTEVNGLLNSADSKDFSFKGFDKFAEEISKSLGQLTELQSMLKTLQNIESTLARASGVSSVTDIETQWQNVSKLIENSIKLDGTFRKNANVDKLASEYNKYLSMGGTNELSSIGKVGKLENSKNIIDAILSKVKELNSQKVDTSSVDKADDELKSVSSTLDDVISRLDHMINLTRDIGNTFYKMFKDASVSDVDKQWSSIESKFKSIADESGKINLSKQKKDIQELVEMYQKYANAGGMKTPFDLTDNAETIKKMNKVYEQMNSKKDGTSVTNETKNFTKVEDSVNSLTSSINIKTEAIKTEANTMELAARAEVKSIQKIIDALNPLIEKIENIPELKIPKEDTILPSKESNISLASNNIKSQIKDVELLTDKTGKLLTVYRGVNSAYTGLHSNRYGGKTFLTAGFGLSESYSGVQNDLQGKIYKANLALKNPLEFNAHGSSWNNISLSDIPQLDDYLKKIQVEVSNKITSFYKSLQNIKDVDIRNIIESALQNVELRTNDHFENNNFDILNSFTGELLGDGTYFEQYFENIISNIPNIVENDISNIDLSKAKNILEDKLKELYDIKKTLADNMLLLDGDYTQSMIPVSYEKAQNYYTDEIIHLAQNAGFDSAIFKNLKDGSNNNEDIFAVFDENQIKNAQLVDLKLEQLKKDYKSLMDIINEYRSAYDINGSLEDAIKSFVNEYWNLDPYEDKYFDSSFIDKAINSGKVKEVEYELTSFDEDTGEQTYKAKEGELERFLSELTKYAQDIQEQYAKINSATASTEPTKDAFPGSSTNTKPETEGMEQVEKATDEAVQAKKDFATANEGVRSSIDGSENPLKLEAELMEQIAKSAREAADAKKEFVNANKQANDSANGSNNDLVGSHSENAEPSGVKKYKKKGYKAHDTGNHDNEKKVSNKAELGKALKDLQSEIIASIDESTSFVKEVTDFYDSQDNLVKTQMKIGDKNGSMRTYTTSYSMDKDGNATAWTSHIETQKIAEQIKQKERLAESTRKLRQEEKQSSQDSVHSALKDQVFAWKQIQSIREKIAKADNPDVINQLQETKKYYQQQYLDATKILKSNQDLYDTQGQLNRLKQIELETTAKISQYQSKNAESVSKYNQSLQKSATEKLSKYTDSSKYTPEFIERVNSKIGEIGQLDITKPEDITRLKTIDSEVQKIVDDSKLLENKLVKQDSKIADIISQMKIYRSENTNMSSSQKSSLNSMISSAEELAHSGKVTAEQIEQIKIAFSGLKAEISETGRTGKNFFSQIRNRLTDMNSKFVAQFLSWQDWIMYIRQAARMVIDLNTQITELAKVSEQTSKQIYADFDSYADIAKDVGGTISDTISATSDWARNGYGIPDSKELARVALLYKNVGDGINIDEANESLISTLRGFKLEADQAEHIIDVFNEVSNNESISSAGIGNALQRSAASFNAANTSLEKSVALVTATNSVLQDPEKVGNMWKTVSARIRGADTELQEMGEDTEGMVESTSKLQSLIKGMTGFDIMESDGKTFKDIYDIIIGIGEKWNDLNDIDRASLLEKLAGKNQSNALAAALSNIDILKKAYGEASDAQGSAAREQAEYQKSIQYSIDQTKAALEELSQDLISSDLVKGTVDFGGGFITFLDEAISRTNDLKLTLPILLGLISSFSISKLSGGALD